MYCTYYCTVRYYHNITRLSRSLKINIHQLKVVVVYSGFITINMIKTVLSIALMFMLQLNTSQSFMASKLTHLPIRNKIISMTRQTQSSSMLMASESSVVEDFLESLHKSEYRFRVVVSYTFLFNFVHSLHKFSYGNW